jgi:hypothetical protein
MLRAFGAFLAVFSLLSLTVHLEALGTVLGMAAFSLFAIDELLVQFAGRRRSSRIPGEPFL